MARQYQSGDRPVRGEDYELVEFLGEGQFGEVWKATGPGGYLVAVKIIDLTRGEGERESKALEQVKHVRHPNLTPVHASFAIDHGANKVADFETAVKLVVVMGLGDKCLHKRLKECLAAGEQGIPRAELLRYMEAAAKGLDFLHKPVHDLGGEPVPIIHRDIKPHNILVVGDDAQICDFGLARAMESLQKSQTKTLAGTLAYMAPEVLLESKRGDARSDQYSFAVTYVHLRTGRLPFGSSGEPSAGDIFRAHWESQLNLLGLEPRERRVIARAVAKEPGRRYATCSQMVEALRAACKPGPKRGWLSTVFGKKAHEPADYAPERVRGPAEPTQPATRTETQRPRVPGTLVAAPPDEADRTQAEQATASHAEPMDKTVPFGPEGTDAVKERPAPPRKPPRKPPREPEVPEREELREVEAVEPPAPTRRPSRVRRTVAVLLVSAIAMVVGGLSIELWKPGSVSDLVAKAWNGISRKEPPPKTEPKPPPKTEPKPSPKLKLKPEPRPAPSRESFRKLLESGEYPAAAELMGSAPSELQEKLRRDWLADIQRLWETKKSPQEVQQNCGQLLEHFPDSSEAKLVLARALVRLAQYEDARSELEKLDPSPLPEGAHVLHAALRLILDGFLSPDSVDAERFRTFDSLPAPNDFWGPDEQERGYVQGVRDRVFNRYFTQLQEQLRVGQLQPARNTSSEIEDARLPADESEQARFRTWQAIIELRDPQAAPEALDQALARAEDEKLRSSLATDDKRELLQALGDVAQKQRYADAVLAGHLERAIQLVHAMGQKPPLDRDAPRQLGRLWLRRVAIRVMEPEKPTALAEVEDLRKDWKEATNGGFQSTLADARLGTLVDAWLAECLMELGGNEQEVRDLVLPDKPVPEPWAVYVHYVRALARRTLADPPSTILAELKAVFPPDAGPPETVLTVQGRLAKAASTAVEAAEGQRRESSPKSPAAPWRTAPFASPEQADEHYRLLKHVQDLDEAAPAALLDAAGQRQLQVGLALAAFYKTDADVPSAWLLASALTRLSQDLGEDAAPVLSIAVKSYLQHPQAAEFAPADHQIPIQACTRLIHLVEAAERHAATRDESAVALYEDVVQHVLSGANTLASALQKSTAEVEIGVLEEFYATVGDCIWNHWRAKWPFEDVAGQVETLLDWAIYLHSSKPGAEPSDDQARETLAGYHLTRGHARLRLKLKEPNFDGALKDADEAGKIMEELSQNPHGALGLRAHVHLVRAGQQQRYEDYLSELDLSIDNGEKAVQDCPETDPLLPEHRLNLNSAYVLKANYTRDFTFASQEEFLKKAVAHAEKAVGMEQNYPDYPHLALGNAYEDLAWLVEQDPEANFQQAIAEFGKASEIRHYAVEALFSRARCYYKAVAETFLNPRDVGKQDLDDLLTAAKNDLGDAIGSESKRVEAYYYLAKIAQFEARAAQFEAQTAQREKRLTEADTYFEQADQYFKQADEYFGKAKSFAEEQQLPERATYIQSWAAFPLANGDQDLSNQQRYKDALTRAAELEAAPAPPGGLADPKKDAACIRGQVLCAQAGVLRQESQALLAQGQALQAKNQALQAQKKYQEARALYDQILPEDPATADWPDFNLLYNRALCHWYLFQTEGTLPSADAAIRDADRAAELAIGRGQRVAALSHSAAVSGHVAVTLGSGTNQPSDLKTAESCFDKCIAGYEELVYRLASRDKTRKEESLNALARALSEKGSLLRRMPDSPVPLPPEEVSDEALPKVVATYEKLWEVEKKSDEEGYGRQEYVDKAKKLYDEFKQEQERRDQEPPPPSKS